MHCRNYNRASKIKKSQRLNFRRKKIKEITSIREGITRLALIRSWKLNFILILIWKELRENFESLHEMADT